MAHYLSHTIMQCIGFFFSGLNFLDLMVRQGTIDSPPKPPLVPGFECCGIVESVGESTERFEVPFVKLKHSPAGNTQIWPEYKVYPIH